MIFYSFCLISTWYIISSLYLQICCDTTTESNTIQGLKCDKNTQQYLSKTSHTHSNVMWYVFKDDSYPNIPGDRHRTLIKANVRMCSVSSEDMEKLLQSRPSNPLTSTMQHNFKELLKILINKQTIENKHTSQNKQKVQKHSLNSNMY